MAKIGILKESQYNESRVAMNHVSVGALTGDFLKHSVYVTSEAGKKSGISDEKYTQAGAIVLNDNSAVIKTADIIVKIGKPSIEELNLFREGQVLFCFLNLVSDPQYAMELQKRKITAIGYELIYDPEERRYPILSVMSELVGKIAYNVGSSLLSTPGSKGVLLGGLGSTSRSKVVIFGGGHAGKAFMRMADNAGSRVVIFDTNLEKQQKINSEKPHIETMYPFEEYVKKEIKNADLVLLSTFSGGQRKEKEMLTEQMIKEMEEKSVIIDLTYECGGATENTKYNPENKSYTMTKNGIVHYWMPNMASLVPSTATSALASPILIYLLRFLVMTASPNREDDVIQNAIVSAGGELADWIITDSEQNDIEYQKDLEDLLSNDDDEYDLFNMIEEDTDNDFSMDIFSEREIESSKEKQDIKEILTKKKEEKKNKISQDNNFNSDFDFDDLNFDD